MKPSILATTISALAVSLALASAPADARGNGKHKQKHKDRADRVLVVDRGHNPKAQGRHDNGLHLGWYKQRWSRGERIPVAYLEPRYYVDDYRAYGLAPPPDGYRWVRPMDERYLLVQVATGVILEALGY